MTDEQHFSESLIRRPPEDPWGVLGAKHPSDEQGRPDRQCGRTPQGSFEVAWRLAH